MVLTGYLKPGFGVNFLVSTEFGTTKIFSGSIAALMVKLSLFAWETQIEASARACFHFKTLFIWIEAASAKPNNEWSVKTVLNPIAWATSNSISCYTAVA